MVSAEVAGNSAKVKVAVLRRILTPHVGLPVRYMSKVGMLVIDRLRFSIMSIQTSFQADIRPLFTEQDILAMTKAFNLANYDDVKAHAAAIYDRIRGIGGAVMPPPPPYPPQG